MIAFAAYFWMIASFINMFVLAYLYAKTKMVYHLLYVIVWLCCGLWGMTVPALNVPFIQELNTIILPIIAGICGMVGGLMRLNEILHQNQQK